MGSLVSWLGVLGVAAGRLRYGICAVGFLCWC